jgi:hypothetical protein
METRCQKCDGPVSAEEAFCPRCGAVQGMADAGASRGEGWDLAATVVGQQLPTAPPPRPSAAQATRAANQTEAASAQVARRGNTVLLAVIGFVAVLLIGGLLILLLYLNSQG